MTAHICTDAHKYSHFTEDSCTTLTSNFLSHCLLCAFYVIDTVLIERILKRKEDDDSNMKGREDDNIKTALKRVRNYHSYLHVTLDWLRDNRVPVVNLDCDCPPDQVWEQLLAIGRLVRPATTIHKDDLSIIPGIESGKNDGHKLDDNSGK